MWKETKRCQDVNLYPPEKHLNMSSPLDKPFFACLDNVCSESSWKRLSETEEERPVTGQRCRQSVGRDANQKRAFFIPSTFLCAARSCLCRCSPDPRTHSRTHKRTTIQLLAALKRLSAVFESHLPAAQIDTSLLFFTIDHTLTLKCGTDLRSLWGKTCLCQLTVAFVSCDANSVSDMTTQWRFGSF